MIIQILESRFIEPKYLFLCLCCMYQYFFYISFCIESPPLMTGGVTVVSQTVNFVPLLHFKQEKYTHLVHILPLVSRKMSLVFQMGFNGLVLTTGTISYDAFGQKIRVRNFGVAGNETLTVDQLMLFQKVFTCECRMCFLRQNSWNPPAPPNKFIKPETQSNAETHD